MQRKNTIETLRELIPNATDEEILVLAGGGAAQFLDDLSTTGPKQSLEKYLDSLVKGGWGDNLGENGGLSDARKIQEGLYAYYGEQSNYRTKVCSICGEPHGVESPIFLP